MIYLEMSGFWIDLEGACADDVADGRGVVVGRDPACGCEGAARRSGGVGQAAHRSGAAGANPGAVGAAASRRWLPVGAGAPDNPDGDLREVDDRQTPLRLGVRDVDARGLGLDPSAAVLPAGADRAGAGRVDGPQAHTPVGCGSRARDHARGDSESQTREAVSPAGSTDRLDRRGGRCATRPTRGSPPMVSGRWRGRAASSRPR
jgi:hypothetical protein